MIIWTGFETFPVEETKGRSWKTDAQEVWACGEMSLVKETTFPVWWLHVEDQVRQVNPGQISTHEIPYM